MVERRRDLWGFALLFVAVCAVFAPVLLNSSVPFGGEDELTGRTWERMLRVEMAQEGHIPLWNPDAFGGMPTVDSLTYPVFYPLHALYGLVPQLRQIFHHVPLHLLLAGIMAYLFARELGLSRRSALLPSLAYALTGYLVTLTYSGHGGKIWTCAYLPLVLFTQRRVLLDPRGATVAAAGLAAAIQMLAGHYQIVFYTWVAGGIQLVWHLSGAAPATVATAAARFGGASRGRAAIAWLLVPFFAIALAAVQFVPALKYSGWSNRAQPDYDFLSSYSFPPGEIFTFGAPSLFGYDAVGGMASYWGSLAIRGSTEYMGVLVLALALVALGTVGRTLLRPFAAIAGGGLGLGLLMNLPGVSRLMPEAIRPDFTLDNAGRVVILAALMAAVSHWGATLTGRTVRADAGPVSPRESCRRESCGLLFVIGAVAAFLMVGDHFSTYPLVAKLPGFDKFRAPHTMVILVSFVVAMLSGFGLDAVVRSFPGEAASNATAARGSRRGRATVQGRSGNPLARVWEISLARPLVVVVAVMGAVLLTAAILRAPLASWIAAGLSDASAARVGRMAASAGEGPAEAVARLFDGALGAWGLATGLWGLAVALVVATLRGALPARAFAVGVFAITVLELFWVGRTYVQPFDEEAAFARMGEQPLVAHVADLMEERHRETGEWVRLANLVPGDIRPNDPLVHGVQLTGGYHGAPMADAWTALRSSVPGFSEAYLRLMGARYFLYAAPLEVEGAYKTIASLTVGGKASGPHLVENLTTYPRARVVHGAVVLPHGEEQMRALASPGHDSRKNAVLDEESPIELPGRGRGSARVVSYETHRVELEVQSDGPGLLVLADSFYPGWKARVNDVERPVVRADYQLRATPIDAGTSRVVFTFEPMENTLGALVTLVASIVALVGIGLGRRRARSPLSPNS